MTELQELEQAIIVDRTRYYDGIRRWNLFKLEKQQKAERAKNLIDVQLADEIKKASQVFQEEMKPISQSLQSLYKRRFELKGG